MPDIELTLVLGRWALAEHLPQRPQTVTQFVKLWEEDWPLVLALPHPSPRNQAWIKKNAWAGSFAHSAPAAAC